MKRFGLLLTMAIIFSLPMLVFAQGTTGSSGHAATAGKKKINKDAAQKVAPKTPQTITAGTGRKKVAQTDTGKKKVNETDGPGKKQY